jgi:DNA-binding transcriptional regulator YiaG
MRNRPEIKREYSGITNDELAALAAAVGMSSRQIAAFFGIKDSTVRHWFSGARPPPVAVVMTLELMRHFELTPEQVRQITGEEESP